MLTKRSFLKSLGSLIALMGISATRPQTTSSGFMHVVYFWFKDPNHAVNRRTFEKSLTSFLDEVDEIQYKFVGTPAGTNREVIDSSFTYNLVVITKDRKDQDIYQDHPAHKRFIAECSEFWEKVVVYDSLPI